MAILSRRYRSPLARLWATATLLALAGLECAQAQQSYEQSMEVTISGPTDPFERFRPVLPALRNDVAGLFIGVSRYDQRWLQSTPAHSLGAMLAYDAFYGAILSGSRSVQGELAQLETSRLRLVTDLSIRPEDKDLFFPGLVNVLANIKHPYPVFDYSGAKDSSPQPIYPLAEAINRGPRAEVFRLNRLDQDGHFPYFRTSRKMHRIGIEAAIDSHIADVEHLLQQRSGAEAQQGGGDASPLLVAVYISTHGGFWHDGKHYLLARDAQEGKPGTWLETAVVISKYEALARKSGRLVETLIIIDACSQPFDLGNQAERMLPSAFANSTIVISSSPGQYAYHWNSQGSTHYEVREDKIAGLRGKQADRQTYDVSFASTMSAFPIAALATLKKKEREAVQVGMYAGPGGRVVVSFSVESWVLGIQEQLDGLLKNSRPDARQTILVKTSGDGRAAFAVAIDSDRMRKK